MYFNTEEEVWKDIKDFEGMYQISSFGRVRSVDRLIENSIGHLRRFEGQPIKPLITGQGYLYVRLPTKDGKRNRFIHRLVAETFIVNHKDYPVVNHINGVKTDNRLSNLEWVTYSQNSQHALKNNLTTTVKLSQQNVLDIRKLYASGEYTQKQLADKFGVGRSNIGRIVRRDTWKFI